MSHSNIELHRSIENSIRSPKSIRKMPTVINMNEIGKVFIIELFYYLLTPSISLYSSLDPNSFTTGCLPSGDAIFCGRAKFWQTSNFSSNTPIGPPELDRHVEGEGPVWLLLIYNLRLWISGIFPIGPNRGRLPARFVRKWPALLISTRATPGRGGYFRLLFLVSSSDCDLECGLSWSFFSIIIFIFIGEFSTLARTGTLLMAVERFDLCSGRWRLVP